MKKKSSLKTLKEKGVTLTLSDSEATLTMIGGIQVRFPSNSYPYAFYASLFNDLGEDETEEIRQNYKDVILTLPETFIPSFGNHLYAKQLLNLYIANAMGGLSDYKSTEESALIEEILMRANEIFKTP